MKRMHINSGHFHAGSPPLLIFALGSLDRLQQVAGALRVSVDCSLSCYPDIFDRRTGYLEIFAPGVSKASSVLRLKEMAGADRMVVFGDNLNDIPMMEQADVAVAVENALPEVKRHATLTIGPNTDDSVARFIEQDFRSQLSDVKTHYNK